MPFDEFTVKDLDKFVAQLEKDKPAGATVEVSQMEDSFHNPCMQEMKAILVQSAATEDQQVHTYSMYQYCPACNIAVRVL